VGKLKEVPCVFCQGETLDELEEDIRDEYQLTIAETRLAPIERAKRTMPVVRVEDSINPPTSVRVNEK
jgi:hypothetical protein